jgi:hypothetical protein
LLRALEYLEPSEDDTRREVGACLRAYQDDTGAFFRTWARWCATAKVFGYEAAARIEWLSLTPDLDGIGYIFTLARHAGFGDSWRE